MSTLNLQALLTELVGSTGTPAGEVVIFGGNIYDLNGLPVAGAVVEIWQTDNSGIYLHPNDPNTAQMAPELTYSYL